MEEKKEKHLLQNEFSFYFVKKATDRSQDDYESRVKHICTFNTVEDFWGFYSHLVRPNDIQGGGDYLLFRSGIKPLWEDKENINGGKWILRLKKQLASRFFEDMILGLIGEQFEVEDKEICGIALSVRQNEDILSIWNKTSQNNQTNNQIRQDIFKILSIPEHTIIEYKAHREALRDKSSFRNTSVAPISIKNDKFNRRQNNMKKSDTKSQRNKPKETKQNN
ncbi:eukaryotic translation initiation factor 4e class ii 2b [Anaeramoeba ignava]|uniref:Eukaryotic translation initiation factor 4e class ii 2b n=1 Tax=Anaeramoeba ignava TaxID=1746090 RepID=A0A9Q0LBR0_ANAIG|nr:eukaryotic translation initiation factor 4e class ii 2b [Anaeramoeba ignava]|eukprot:Anaeramoba_ignava/a609193_95.p1 GENE.a609193_95~~a609193_95.p1  ORF type:complete len:222 (+),score=73.39 a609193_95:47-712(+)